MCFDLGMFYKKGTLLSPGSCRGRSSGLERECTGCVPPWGCSRRSDATGRAASAVSPGGHAHWPHSCLVGRLVGPQVQHKPGCISSFQRLPLVMYSQHQSTRETRQTQSLSSRTYSPRRVSHLPMKSAALSVPHSCRGSASSALPSPALEPSGVHSPGLRWVSASLSAAPRHPANWSQAPPPLPDFPTPRPSKLTPAPWRAPQQGWESGHQAEAAEWPSQSPDLRWGPPM